MGKKSFEYNRSGDFIEINIKDRTYRSLDKFKCNIADAKSFGKIAEIINRKYNLNINPEITVEDSINNKPKEKVS